MSDERSAAQQRLDEAQAVNNAAEGIESDPFHPTLGFDGEAQDTLDMFLRNMYGYGVTLTLEDGTEVEAVLGKPAYDESEDRLHVWFFRVTDGEYPMIDSVPAERLEKCFVKHIQVS